jgi:hypothetical protein
MKANQNLHFGKKQNGEIEDESVEGGSFYTGNLNGKEHTQGVSNTFFRYDYSDLKEHSIKMLNGKAKRINNLVSRFCDDENLEKVVMEVFNKDVRIYFYSSIFRMIRWYYLEADC